MKQVSQKSFAQTIDYDVSSAEVQVTAYLDSNDIHKLTMIYSFLKQEQSSCIRVLRGVLRYQ